jgi:predicted dehydrogenase
MNPITFLIIGAGDRGFTYSGYSKLFPDEMKIVGVAEPNDERRKLFQEEFGLCDSRVFNDYETAFQNEKFANAVIVTTPDDMHFLPAMKALEKGYAVLLEKPISNKLDDCISLNEQNNTYNGLTAVCHVLRYTPFFKKIKEIIESGIIGNVVTIEHIEGVGWWHQAHSFVRGNWSDTMKTSPMILAKSCHDMDILIWLTGKHCKKIASFGSLIHFKSENAPDGSTERCTDNCKVENECPYSALRLYMNMEKNDWPISTISNDLSYEGRIKALNEGPYGKCVYRCDNDAVDHQVVSLEFEGGVTATFTMSAFTNPGRRIRVMGAMGEITGSENLLEVTNFRNGKTENFSIEMENVKSGHGGGDFGLMSAFIKAIQNKDKNYISSTLEVSLESHRMAFAAEESRVKGEIIQL